MSGQTPAAAARTRRLVLVDALLLLVAVGLLGGRRIAEGGFGWSDGPLHAMDGAFVLALLRDLPLDHLRQWAEEFYVRHPILGFIVYYPPGFAVIEALFYAVGGVGVVPARLCVLAHAWGACVMLYLIVAREFDRRVGLTASLLLLTSPHGALWLFDIMLEWPATFWLLLTVGCYFRLADTGSARWAVAVAAAFTMTVMVKQTAGFIGPVLVAHAALTPSLRGRVFRPIPIVCAVAAAAVVSAYFLLARRYTALPAELLKLDLSDPLFYFSRLGEISGWPIALLAAVGVVSLLRDRPNGRLVLPLLWFAAWAGFSTSIAAREPRYFFFALPPLAIAAALCCEIHLRRFRAGLVVVAWIIALQGVAALREHPRYLPRYDRAVRTLLDTPDADLVLVDAVRDGQFVFDAYADRDARNRLIPLRASKLLYARAAREKYGYQQFVHSPADVLAVLDRSAIRYVLLESELPATPYIDADPPPRAMLRDLVADASRFQRVAAWPLRCADPAWDRVELRLYRYLQCPAHGADTITLAMPSMGGDVTIPLPRPRTTPP